MSETELDGFGKTAKSLAGSPLGIIALFIVLIYGFAALTFGISARSLNAELQIPLVWFLVLFPVLVLMVFTRLVMKHHQKLYGPSDFTDQSLFIQLQAELRDLKSEIKPVIEREIESEPTVESRNLVLRSVQLEDVEEKLLRILATGKYTFRTTRGLAREAGISAEKTQTYLENLSAKNLVGQRMLKNGFRWYIEKVGAEMVAPDEKD